MPLDFSFTPEQDEFRAFVRDFAQKEIQPYVADWDAKEEMPWHAINKMGEYGLIGLVGPKHLGGQEHDYYMLGIAIEEIARVDTSCAMICSVQNTLSTLVPGWGDDVISEVYAGRKMVCIATSEHDAGSDVSNMRTNARIEGDEFVINGQKIHVSLMPGAQYMGVTAKVDYNDGKPPRITWIKVPSDSPGVSCHTMEEMGVRSHQLGVVDYKDVRVPVTNVLGEAGQGKAALYARWNVSRCLSALNALGTAQQVLDDTIEFVKTKKVYGRPIGLNQAISFPLLEHATRVEACRLLAYKGLWINNIGENAAKEASMSKWFAVSLATQAIHDCLLMYGANGYLKSYPVERRLRDVIGLAFTGGTINVMKIIALGQVMGREFMNLRD